ncbi:MAG: rRNA maturation RNase YbeY [Gammaproteobacteria bacterium]|nr:MAG: rRNA maturation RNase YbeY [Gammaproteobacteria bacterium]
MDSAPNTDIVVDIQTDLIEHYHPSADEISTWVGIVLTSTNNNHFQHVEVSLKIVEEQEGAALNQQYRGKPGPTNILSFPLDPPKEIPFAHLGDLVVCAPVVEAEAIQQQKSASQHWTHMIIHGILHLLGFDHINDKEAEIMESLEIDLMQQLGLPNPYIETHTHP